MLTNKIIKDYCPVCNKIVPLELKEIEEQFSVKDQSIKVMSIVPICTVCHNDVFVEEYDEINLLRAYEEYRKQNHLLTVEQIRGILEKYGLSQSDLAKSLGWGAKTITRYLNGDIQSKGHNEMLRLVRRPHILREVFEGNREQLTENEINRIDKAINQHMEKDKELKLDIIRSMNTEPDIYNGNRAFDYDRAYNAIAYFLSEVKDVYKTKLNKLLFYSDFVSYRETGQSITGFLYVHLDYGPVPDKFDIMLGLLMNEKAIREESVEFPSGACGTKYLSNVKPKMNIFSKEEKIILKKIVKFIEGKTSKDISMVSHDEAAYKKTDTQDLISYEYANSIKI